MIQQTATSTASDGSNQIGPFAGTFSMLRLMARLDRLSLPIWIASIAAFTVYYGALLYDLYTSQEELNGAAEIVLGSIGALMVGPAYGFGELTYPRFLVGAYGLYIYLPVALMSILCVVRHTRTEEAAGRAELMRANVLGRYATLTSAMVLTVISNLVLAIVITVGLMSVNADYTFVSTALFASSIAAVGIVFAAVAALVAQLTENPGAATGISIGVLGAAFVIRGAGDMIEQGGSWLSWFSPLAWSQQTAPFVLDRWWPLVLSLALSVIIATCGYVLSARRDVGAGVLPARPGPTHAADWINSPFALAAVLRRSGIIWWTVALGATSLLMGGLAQNVADSVVDLPPAYQELLGAGDDLVHAYLNVFGLMISLTIGGFVITCLQSMRSEETAGRTDSVLSTATSRDLWMGSYLLVVATGALILHVVNGFAMGIGAWASTGRGAVVLDGVGAQLTFYPATMVILGVGAAMYGLWPRGIDIAWALIIYGALVGLFGPMFMNLPEWFAQLSPYDFVAQVPVESFAPVPAVTLVLSSIVLVAAGLGMFRGRDLNVR